MLSLEGMFIGWRRLWEPLSLKGSVHWMEGCTNFPSHPHNSPLPPKKLPLPSRITASAYSKRFRIGRVCVLISVPCRCLACAIHAPSLPWMRFLCRLVGWMVSRSVGWSALYLAQNLWLPSTGKVDNKWRGVTISLRMGGQGQPTPIHTQCPTQPPFQLRHITPVQVLLSQHILNCNYFIFIDEMIWKI